MSYNETYFVLPYMGICCYGHFCQKTQNKVMNTPSNNPLISEEKKCLDRYVAVQMCGLG